LPLQNYFNNFVTSYKLLQVRKNPVFFNLMISGQQIDAMLIICKRYVTLPLTTVLSTEACVVVEDCEENFENWEVNCKF
jgi:hypothetical protein